MTNANTAAARVWILGAADPEMEAIHDLLTAAGESVVYAVGDDGQRVHPGNAYKGEGVNSDVSPEWGRVYLVECDGIHLRDACGPGREFRVIDHHREGDAGYGRPPEEFLAASSIGQVVSELAGLDRLPWAKSVGQPGILPGEIRWTDHGGSGWAVFGRDANGPWKSMIPDAVIWAAAADHCLEAAYRGRCPGVDPDALMAWRVESRAAHQGRAPEEVMADVEEARMALRCAVVTGVDPQSGAVGDQYMTDDPATWVRREYADLRGRVRIPELPEAAAREGIPFIATVSDRDGREKVVLQAAPPDLVERFLGGRLVSGLKDVYGDPARGFAGGYIQQ